MVEVGLAAGDAIRCGIAAHADNIDRRPIAARRLGAVQWLARALARRRVPPNLISVMGLIAAVLAGVALAVTRGAESADHVLYLAAAALVQLRLLCNLLDGLVAVEGGLGTPTGELYNEVPDRVSDAAILIGAGCAAQSSPALGFVAAIAAIGTAYIRVLGKAAGLPSDFRGPMAKQQRVFVVTAGCVYLAAAPRSWRPEFPAFLDAPSPGLLAVLLVVIAAGSLLTAARRLAAIARALKDRAG